MRLSLTMPMGPHTVITEEATAGLVGQWVTVLAFGRSVLARVESAERSEDGTSVALVLAQTEPEEEAIPEPEFTWGTVARGVHINCEHDTEASPGGNVVCDGPA